MISITYRIPRLSSLYFYLTRGCNLRCRHCWIISEDTQKSKDSSFLPVKLFKDIIEQAIPLGCRLVKLTGGEPLMHPQIDELLSIIKDKQLSLVVETNGVLCNENIVSLIVSCKNPFVSVSLDSAESSVHEWLRQVSGSFVKALEGIKQLVSVGLRPQIIMSIFRYNCHQDNLKCMVELAEKIGAGSLKFNFITPIVKGKLLQKEGLLLSVQETLELYNWIQNTLSRQTPLKIFANIPPAFKPLHTIFNDKDEFCSCCSVLNILGVLNDGAFAMCGIGVNVPELVWGNAHKDKLERIWQDTPTILELRDKLPFALEGVCRRCIFKIKCMGYCTAMSYYVSGSLFSPYWFCQEAYIKGLFPSQRLIVGKNSIIQEEQR